MTFFLQTFGTLSLPFSYEIKLYMKSAWQAEMSLEIFILRIQLYISAFSLTIWKTLASSVTNFVQ